MPPNPSQLLFLCTLCIFFFFFFATSTEANNYLTTHCPNATVFSPNTTFASNLHLLLSALTSHSSASSGFFAATAGNTSAAHGLFLCRGDLSAAACRACVASAASNATLNCPAGRAAAIWYSDCTLRYSDRRIAFSPAETSPIFAYHNLESAVDSTAFLRVLNRTLSNLISNVGENVADGKMYSTVRQVGEPAFPAMYGLAQCVPELGVKDCRICLRLAIQELPICCGGKIGARVLLPNCNIRYEPYVFFNSTTTRNSSSIDSIPSATKRKNWVPLIITLGVVVPVLVLVAVLAVACRLRIQKQKSKGEEDISMVDSLQYDLRTIIAATGNFSDDNKLGEGGFGAVYKGVLPNGQEIAAKRLSRTSMQGVDEFRNEIELVAKLQHRNLVRLLGICFQGEEKILVYEFVPNKSLDYLIFDDEKGVQLDWSIRYKIIVGTARGLLYLHEDSRLRIVHRDLKASNVLLDGDMNPKISDFGMARMFGGDETHGNTCRIVGTYGYMSPEYVMFGHFSTKSDVYSFGILVLEIICGMKNSLSYKLGEGEGLLHYAWRHWTNGTHMELLDPNLRGSCSTEELKRCIHIGLLCVQEEVEDRPTMASVIFMLNGDSVCPEMPQHPAFLSKGRLGNGVSGSCSMNLYDEETGESQALSLSEETSEYR